ncbi:hypothetical protein ACFQS6_02245 [Xanthomonas populi]
MGLVCWRTVAIERPSSHAIPLVIGAMCLMAVGGLRLHLGSSQSERYPTRELSGVLTALKSGVKFLTKSKAKRVFCHTSVCFYYFFDKSL